MVGINARIHHCNHDTGISECPVDVNIPEKLPCIWRVHQLVIPLLGEKEICRDNGILLDGMYQVGFGKDHVFHFCQPVGYFKDIIARQFSCCKMIHVPESRHLPYYFQLVLFCNFPHLFFFNPIFKFYQYLVCK